MATIKFRLSSKADKVSGKCEVLVRFFHGRIDQYAKTNVFVSPDYWNAKTERLTIPRVRIMTEESTKLLKDLSDTNARLEALKEYINQSFIEAGAGKVLLPGSWLSDRMNEYNFPVEEQPKSLLSLLQKYIDVKEVAESRKRHFNVVWRAFKRFCIVKGIDTNVGLDDVNADTIRAFVA